MTSLQHTAALASLEAGKKPDEPHGPAAAASPKRRFLLDATAHVADVGHRSFVRSALTGYYKSRDAQKARYRDWEHARDAASLAKWSAVNQLDTLLEQFADNFEARGGRVHWAANAEEARQIILDLLRKANAKAIIKSKCMTSEEIHLNAALEEEGFGVVESDLGEFIQQLRGEPPYHFVFPCMHVRREEISRLFQDNLGTAPTDSPEELTMIARDHMRQLYVDADVGITGANFLVAETGQISITENEGNARLTAALPRMHIALVGIEKVVANLDDLSVLLPMLATAGAGQPMTCYNTLYGGPRQDGECDGPEEMHVVLLDNHRSAILADPEQRDSLQCIRCGACLNVCPIFKNVGGFTYGTTYQGPIGSVITPHLRGLADWNHLSGASSLCGACSDACPVRIDIHHHLLHNRRNAARTAPSRMERLGHRLFVAVASRPWLFRIAGWIARHTMGLARRLKPPLVREWLASRDLPSPPQESFRSAWRRRQRSATRSLPGGTA
ncbi:MAG: iron-sulfur cluster-binding protein [Pirellulales bacterium]|jgi:L-lactate dehydrogenase complex protein LldF|nr:iron-sulfur cluster-binding protein [Pirellulales bacterium]